MKKIILPLLVLSLSASSTFAQKWSIGLNAGGELNTAPFQQHYYNEQSSAFGGAATLIVQKKLGSGWQIGVGLDYQRISTRVDGYDDDIRFFVEPPEAKGVLAIPTISMVGRVNRLFTKGKFQYYGGISTGFNAMGNGKLYENNRMWNAVSSEEAVLGWRGGLQVGANLKLSQHWGANAEIGGNYFRFGFDELADKRQFISTTCTFGIHYFL
jgi:Outer membrane protein beta-barrel domain